MIIYNDSSIKEHIRVNKRLKIFLKKSVDKSFFVWYYCIRVKEGQPLEAEDAKVSQ
jgi:hypothetical protein